MSQNQRDEQIERLKRTIQRKLDAAGEVANDVGLPWEAKYDLVDTLKKLDSTVPSSEEETEE